MKKFFWLVVGCVGLIVGFLISTNRLNAIEALAQFETLTESVISETTQPAASPDLIAPIPSPSPIVAIEQPVELKVEALAVAAEVELVGLDQRGRMDVPKQDANVAWYQLGAKPGDVGSAVIAGHYDSRTGGPAVFYELGSLKPGDEVEVTGNDGKALTFVVEKVATYKDATFPVETVFGQNDARRLNLITCAGTFNQQAKNYSDRLVVFTKLKQTTI